MPKHCVQLNIKEKEHVNTTSPIDLDDKEIVGR
jgi:hypothetical protein